MEEVWKPIEGYEDRYEISNKGRVKSLIVGNIKNPYVMKNGYYAMTLYKGDEYKDGKRIRHTKHYLIHRLVAAAFIPNPNNLPCINHIDENKHNNHVENLEWCTYSQNMLHNDLCKRIAKKLGRRVGKYSLDGLLLKEYDSAEQASRVEHVGATSIRNWLEGIYPCTFGFVWKYLD